MIASPSQLHHATRAAAIDPQFRAAVEHALVPLATEHRWIPRDERSLELAALLRRDAIDAFRAAGETLRISMPHVPFLLSGPWPLEVFADER